MRTIVSLDIGGTQLRAAVSQSGPLLFDSFQASLKEHVIHPRYLEGLVIARAELGDNSGLLGARALAELKLDS